MAVEVEMPLMMTMRLWVIRVFGFRVLYVYVCVYGWECGRLPYGTVWYGYGREWTDHDMYIAVIAMRIQWSDVTWSMGCTVECPLFFILVVFLVFSCLFSILTRMS